MIRQFLVSIASSIALLAPAFAAEPIQFQLEQIATFDEPNEETFGLALAINEFGEVVGIADDADLVARGFRYSAGELSEIAGFEPDLVSHPRAINQFGDVVGGAGHRVTSGGHAAIVTVPFLRPEGGAIRALMTAQEIAAGQGGMAFTLNDSGVVAFEGPGALVALPGGERTAWGFPGGGIITTGSVNQLGLLVGTGLRPGASGFEALLFDTRGQTTLNLHDPSQASISYAVDINNPGVIVGEWLRLDNDRTVPVMWRNGQGAQLPFVNEELAGWVGHAIAINDRGDVLGESFHPRGERLNWLLFAGTTAPVPLVDLLDESFFVNFDDFMAFDLNNSREIAGTALRVDPEHPLGSTNKPGILVPNRVPRLVFPAPGLWANLSEPGSGFEINRVGDHHYLVWQTYDTAGLPVWYFSQTVRMTRDGWRADLLEFSRNTSGTITSRTVGQVVLQHRQVEEMLFSWRLEGRSGTSVHRYLPGNCEFGAKPYTGTWHDPANPGFGISVQDLGQRQIAIFYFYDRNGKARWALFNFPSGPGSTEAWLFHGGACPQCNYAPPQRSTIGSARLELTGATLGLEVGLAGTGNLAAMTWNSVSAMTRIPSPPNCNGPG